MTTIFCSARIDDHARTRVWKEVLRQGRAYETYLNDTMTQVSPSHIITGSLKTPTVHMQVLPWTLVGIPHNVPLPFLPVDFFQE